MKILIVGTARSGTTSLMNAIASGLKLNICNEPFLDSNDVNYNVSMNNLVLKTMVNHTPFSKIDELRYSFDKTILLSRKDVNAVWESICNVLHISDNMLCENPNCNLRDAWLTSYVHNENVLRDEHKILAQYRLDTIIQYSLHCDIDIIWYEDLFSLDRSISETTFNSLGLDIPYENIYEYINPEKRYRK